MPDAKKILIVDDEPHVLRSLGFVLRRAGYAVLEARGGEEALELIMREHPELVFLDIMMPEMDGYEVCRRVKAEQTLADIHVVLLTAKGHEGDRRQGLAAGADEYMTKPFSPSRAVERVRAIVGDPDR